LRADSSSDKSLHSKDSRKLWNNVFKVSNNKATKYATTVGGVSGDRDSSNMWKQHFEQFTTPSIVAMMKVMCFATAFNTINTSDIATVLQQQKKGRESHWA